MPIATRERYEAMLATARDGGFAYPAVNVTSSQTLNAALDGFAAAGSDGIVQITVGGAEYLGGGDALRGAQAFAALAHELAGRVAVDIALHTDHCPPERERDFLRPLIAGGRFNSHMFDGSSLPLRENLTRSRALLELTRAAGLVLELEVGAVGGEEDGIAGAGTRYTTTEDLLAVADALGTSGYLLAAAFGTFTGCRHRNGCGCSRRSCATASARWRRAARVSTTSSTAPAARRSASCAARSATAS